MKKIQHIFSCLLLAMAVASCSQDMELDSKQGYLALKMNTLVSTNNPDGTRADAPAGYNAKQLHVEIRNASGSVVKSTDNFQNDQTFQGNIPLEAGDYTIVAHSQGWDGNGSGFDAPYYYGSTSVTVTPQELVTARLTCTQANVKVTVNYDPTFAGNFATASTNVSSSVAGVSPLDFVMGQNLKPGYFPVGSLTVKLNVTNKSGVSNSLTKVFDEVNARDHYIFNFKMASEGQLGDGTGPGITVEVDESTNTYTYTFEVPKKSGISFTTRAANAWSTFAYLNGAIASKTASFQNNAVTIQWRQSGTTNWNEMKNSELSIDASDNITAHLKGLTPETSYEYRIRYVEGDNEVESDVVSFTTESQTALYNGDFQNWWTSGKVVYPNAEGTSYWDTSNTGAAKFGGSITTQSTSVYHGGGSAAKLESKFIVIKFAAASMYTGEFVELVGTKGAKLKWGVPFTGRPTALKGFMQYAPVAVDRTDSKTPPPSDAPSIGESDLCGMYCALLTEQLNVDNTDMSTFPDWLTDPRVVAYGSLPDSENVHSNGVWKEVNIPLVYNNLNVKPTHLLVVFSSSKYGDYFHGGAGSTLYVDDFELVYGDNPSVQ